MNYKVIREEFGGQPLAGYMMNIIDLTRNKDGLDAMAFLKKVEAYVNLITEESEADDGMFKEFFFVTDTDEDTFALNFYICRTIDDLVDKEYVDGWEYEDTHYYRMCTEDEEWGLDEIILTEGEDMDKITAQNIINITREFDNLYRNGEISNSDDAEEMIIDFATSQTLYTTDFIRDQLKQKFPLEDKYDLVEVEVSRVRKVLEKAVIKVAVAKSFGEDTRREAEDYVENSFCGESSLDWEVEDDEYEFEDLVVSDSEISDTDTLEELECAYDACEVLE